MTVMTGRVRAFLVLAMCAVVTPLAAAETKDRVNMDELRSRIQPAADLAEEDRFDEAEAAFKAILRRNPDLSPVDQLDLTTAFAVELCTSSRPETSFPYLRRAIELAAVAFGPQHPETALAYTDLADCLGKTPQTRDGTEREDAYRSSYAIRMASLGADNAETAASMSGLAQFIADQRIGALKPTQVHEALDLFDRAIQRFQALGEDSRPDLEAAMLGRAELSAKSGHAKAAVADFEAVQRLAPGPLNFGAVASLDVCDEIAAAFRRQGEAQQAQQWSSRCTGMRDSDARVLESLFGVPRAAR